MKLVQRKCPNCGASLSFDEEAKKVTCEYCKQTLTIEREENHNNFDTTDFSLHVAKYYEKKNNNFGKKVAITIVIVLVLVFVVSCISILNRELNRELEEMDRKSTENSNRQEELKKQYTLSIADIDEKSLELFHKETKRQLDEDSTFLPRDSKETEWEPIGIYLLVSKKMDNYHERMNMLFDVYKKTYTVNNQQINSYSARRYDDLKLSSDKIVIHSFSGRSLYIMNFINGGMSYFTSGYETMEELYTKEIRQYIGDYTITATDGLYMEK